MDEFEEPIPKRARKTRKRRNSSIRQPPPSVALRVNTSVTVSDSDPDDPKVPEPDDYSIYEYDYEVQEQEGDPSEDSESDCYAEVAMTSRKQTKISTFFKVTYIQLEPKSKEKNNGNANADSDAYTIFRYKFFTRVPNPKPSTNTNPRTIFATCNTCKNGKVIQGESGSTSNFVRHLKKHPKEMAAYNNKKKERKLQRTNNIVKSTPARAPGKLNRDSAANKRALIFIIDGLHTFCIADEPGFQNMFPGTKIHHRTTVTNRVKQLREQMNELLAKKLANVPLCLTADIWSSKSRSFLGVTAHYLNEDLSRENYALACQRFKGTHSWDKIGEKLTSICSIYNIDNNQIIATVTDNGSNFLKAFKLLGIKNDDNTEVEVLTDDKEDLDDDELANLHTQPLEPPPESDAREYVLSMHVSCGSHSLSLIAAADYVTILKEKEYTALKQMHYQFMSKASVLWSAMKRPKSSEEIKEILSRSVVYPVETRWNSLFDAIGDLLKHRDKEKFLLNQIFKKLGKCDPFTANDYRYMQIYRNVMEPIAKTIDILQGEKDTHYGIFLPSIHSIYIKLTNLIWQTNDALEKKLGNAVLAKLDFRFKKFIDIDLSHEVVRFAVVATLSHPQLKLDWKIAKKSDPEEITELNKVMIALVKNAILKHNCHSHLNSSDQSSASDSCDKPNLKYMFIERNDNQTAAASIEKTIDTQITLYLNSPSRDDLEQFVIMKKLFKIHNTVLPSSAPVERLFNMPSIISRSRFNLNDENFENAVVLKVNRQKLSLLEL